MFQLTSVPVLSDLVVILFNTILILIPNGNFLIVPSSHFVSDICVLLGYYAVQSGNPLSMFSENLSVP